MSGQTWQLWEVDGTDHPDDSVLLAYIRRQPFAEKWPSLRQHIFSCNQCLQRYKDLTAMSALLSDTLASSQNAQNYPPLAGDVWEVIQNPAIGRQARRKRRQAQLRADLALSKALVIYALSKVKIGVVRVLPTLLAPGGKKTSITRLRAMPTTIALLLLAIVVVLAFTVTTSAFGLLHVSGEIIPLPLQTTATIPSQAVTSVVYQHTVTPAAGSTMLKLCTTSSDTSQSRMRICGSHFTPGDRVQLIVQTAAGQQHARHTLLVDAQGNFQDAWIVLTCKDYPKAALVEDLTHALTALPELHSDQLGRCRMPGPVAAVGF